MEVDLISPKEQKPIGGNIPEGTQKKIHFIGKCPSNVNKCSAIGCHLKMKFRQESVPVS